jgi:hypothetical protein
MRAQGDVAEVEHVAVLHVAVGGDDAGARAGLVGPLEHGLLPFGAGGAPNLLAGLRHGVDRQILPVGAHKSIVAQPVIAVIVRIEHRDHRLVAHLGQLPDDHLADLHRGTRVEDDQAFGGFHRRDIAHHALIALGGKAIGGVDHIDMVGNLGERHIGHLGAANEVHRVGGEGGKVRRGSASGGQPGRAEAPAHQAAALGAEAGECGRKKVMATYTFGYKCLLSS